MPSSSVRIGCALFVVAGISLLSGCSDGGTAVLEFGESDPLNGGMRPIPASLRVSVDERFGQFGELRLESMEPQEIPYESKNNPGTTFYKHRYRMRLTFVDDLDASQRQAIRDIFDELRDPRENWLPGITVHGHTSQTALGDRGASLIYTKQYRYGIEMPAADNPTHCTVRLEFEPPLPVDFDTFAAAAKQHAIDFEYAPLQQAFTSDRFEVIKSHGDGFGSSPELHHVRLDFGDRRCDRHGARPWRHGFERQSRRVQQTCRRNRPPVFFRHRLDVRSCGRCRTGFRRKRLTPVRHQTRAQLRGGQFLNCLGRGGA